MLLSLTSFAESQPQMETPLEPLVGCNFQFWDALVFITNLQLWLTHPTLTLAVCPPLPEDIPALAQDGLEAISCGLPLHTRGHGSSVAGIVVSSEVSRERNLPPKCALASKTLCTEWKHCPSYQH